MGIAFLLGVAFWLYTAAAFEFKRQLYPLPKGRGRLPRSPRCGWLFIVSPDYWWARKMKLQLAAEAPTATRARHLKKYVQDNNKMNLQFSLVLAGACVVVKDLLPESMPLAVLGTIALIRFASRSIEIAYAFGLDVFQTAKSSTGLRKHERIRLALFSYVEIYLYSMAAYTVLPTVASGQQALLLSLNVGTLTNVGYAYSSRDVPSELIIVFGQVITTLSLVVLSLAAYLSRRK